MIFDSGLPSAESSPASEERGGLHPPHTAEKAGRLSSRTRVLSVKLAPSKEQWIRLRELAWQAMRYKNLWIRATWAEAIGLRIDPSKGDKHDLQKHIRKTEKDELSGVAYAAAEREVSAHWERDGKRILAGAPMPQFRQNDSFSIRGHKNRNESGVRLSVEGDGFMAELQAQAQTCEGGCWIGVPLARGSEIDSYHGPVLAAMAKGTIAIAKGTLVFSPERGRLLLKLAYEAPQWIPVIGERVATLGPVTRERRLLLRTETATVDYTHKLTQIFQRKESWDGMRRRAFCQIGRHRGAARAKRKVMANTTFDDWMTTFIHQWSREIVEWCKTQGVGVLCVLDLSGGDWPAFKFGEFLKYKAKDAGIEMKEIADLEDAGTERAAVNEVKKRQRKAKRLGDAVRTLNNEMRN